MLKTKKINNKRAVAETNWKWSVQVLITTVAFSGSISLFSNVLLKKFNILVAFIILIFIILIGTLFDIIGVAVTVSDETPFHSMASKKSKDAKMALKLIKNANKVSTICQDVVGDICGIISGSIGALISAKIILHFMLKNDTIISAVIGTAVSTVTILGKSFGKSFAINNSNTIVYRVSQLICIIKKDR